MLTLQFIPYAEIEKLDSDKRISKILKSVKSDKIVLLEGRLKPQEEAELIRKTMEQINEKFKGIELSVVKSATLEESLFKKLKSKFINLILGDRYGFTIIGPAKIVKEIKQDPDKIQLLTDYTAPSKKR